MTTGTIFQSLPAVFSPLVPLKPVVRKSILPPQTWFLCDRRRPLYVIKFSAGSPRAARMVLRETAFYAGLAQYQDESPVVKRIPRLVWSGELLGSPAMILGYCNLPMPGRWIPRMMRWASAIVSRWQRGILKWLAEFQDDAVVRASLAIPPQEVPCHGDFSHFNILGAGDSFQVFDWENWTSTEYRFLDPLHLLVMPTLGGENVDSSLKRFERYWTCDNSYRRHAVAGLGPFLSGMDWQEAMVIYLRFQAEALYSVAPEIEETFLGCEEAWRRYRG